MSGIRRPTRLLLAYANQQEAINHLVASAPPTPEDIADASRRWQDKTMTVAAAGPRLPLDPDPEPLPTELESWAGQIAASAEFQFLLGNLQPHFSIVSLRELIAIQKFVYSDGSVSVPNRNDLSALFRLTAPEYKRMLRPTVKDDAAMSYTMASENPNLRIGGMTESDVMITTPGGAQMPLHVFGYFATYGGPWMQVARFQGRWLLRDGYHRAYLLLKDGIERIPCTVVEATTLADLGVVRPGFVDPSVLLGDRPPRVGDFIDDAYAVNGSVVPVRKIVRIRAEEFVIASDD